MHDLSPQPAIVLHRRPYRESSLLVDFFTRSNGKVRAVCRGIRNSKSDRKSLLQPFQPLLVVLKGKRELKTMTSVEAGQGRFSLDSKALFSAMYLNELLNRVLPFDVAMQPSFDLYLATLLRLSEQEQIEPVLREFELQLLSELGYAPSLRQEAETGRPLDADRWYHFVNDRGLVEDFTRMGSTVSVFRGDVLLQVAEKQWTAESLQCAKRLTRMALHPILGDKPLKSRELFKQLEQPK